VIRIMLEFKASLLAGEAAQIEEMALRWKQSEDVLQASFDALALDIATRRQNGEEIKLSKLVRLDRYKSLLQQTTQQLDLYTTYAENRVRLGQLEHLKLGIQHAVDAIQAYFATRGRVAGVFDILPVGALQALAGLAGDGSPLKQLLIASWPDAVDGLTRKLVEAITLGKNPIDTARAMRDGYGVGFHRSINIARTEQLCVYRTAGLEQYKTSGLVAGYKRLSARDGRVCPACLMADDGTIYSLDTPFEEHPQGRCSQVPVVKGLTPVTWQSGQSWFVSQNEATQKSILGAGRYDAWKAGQFQLSDVVKRVENDVWGTSLQTASLKELIK
jgi:SPP1 gp7 family putative phage head morphogenesis protein